MTRPAAVRSWSARTAPGCSFEPVSFHRIDTFNLRVQANAAGGTIELRKGSPTGDVVGTAEVPATGLQYRDVAVDVSDLGSETMDLYLVFTGASDIKLNFFEAIGQGVSPEAKPVVTITAPVDGDKLDPGAEVEVAADASDADGSIAKVEFFAGDTKIGEDTTAPYTVDWTTPDRRGPLRAHRQGDRQRRATPRPRGSCRCRSASSSATCCRSPTSTASSSASAPGSSGSPVRAPTPGRASTSTRRSTSRPAATTSYDAVVRVDASTLTHKSGKAGLIIRNDMTQPGTSPGYAMLAWRPCRRDGVPHRPRRQRPAQRVRRRRHQHASRSGSSSAAAATRCRRTGPTTARRGPRSAPPRPWPTSAPPRTSACS